MSLTLRKLLQNPSMHLRPVVSSEHDDDVEDSLDREFEWLHATDMIDPTPFLGPAEVILTLGWQFPVTKSADPAVPEVRVGAEQLQRIYDDYAALVSAHGVIGVGFGSDVLHRGVPRELAKACRKHGLILFDVPYEISFMDLLQEAARVLQRDQTERYSRSLRAQKAIANAATRRDGLRATLRETARQLGCGVSLYDPLGRAITHIEAPSGSRVQEHELSKIVQQAIEDNHRFVSVRLDDNTEVVLQALGEPSNPGGMLVLILSQGFDDLSRNVLTSVLALVSVSLEQNQALESLQVTLREALLQLLLAGNIQQTEHIVRSLWGSFPKPPLAALVGVSPQSDASSRLVASADSLLTDFDPPTFFTRYRGSAAILLPEDEVESVVAQIRPFGLTLGLSRFDRWDGVETALEEALKAAEFGVKHARMDVVAFTELWQEGISDLIDASDAAHVARRFLAPLLSSDAEAGTSLVHTLDVWLRNNCRQQPSATELGVHRHTLAARLDQISLLIGSDLDDYQLRAELVLALKYL
ncbi:MAG: helix-turn-helix domain-containing protein [Canibacter sp.]